MPGIVFDGAMIFILGRFTFLFLAFSHVLLLGWIRSCDGYR